MTDPAQHSTACNAQHTLQRKRVGSAHPFAATPFISRQAGHWAWCVVDYLGGWVAAPWQRWDQSVALVVSKVTERSMLLQGRQRKAFRCCNKAVASAPIAPA